MPRLAACIAFVIVSLALLYAATLIGDKPQVMITASPVCAKPLPNPCAQVRCQSKIDHRSLT